VVAEVERVTLLRALRCVSSVFVFGGDVVDEWIRWIRPDVFVTNIESLRQYPSEQATAVEVGAVVHTVDRDPDGPSTSAYLRTMRKHPAP
jgi:bifunctional ADP-heptose synthase (sugar kinase/adenylyltransferase)